MCTGISVLYVLCLFSQFCLVFLYLVSLWSGGFLVRNRSTLWPVPGGRVGDSFFVGKEMCR